MKKSLIVFLGILLVVGFSISAYALHKAPETEYNPGMVTKKGVQIEMSGSIRVRGEIRDNTNTTDLMNDEGGNHRDDFDTRVRLKFKAQVTPNTYGVVELETGATDGDTYEWGQTNAATGNIGNGLGNEKLGDLTLRQAYIAHQFHLTGDKNYSTGVKAGHMLLALGNGLYLDHTKFGDDAIILWTDAGPGEIAFAFAKLNENDDDLADDASAYALTLDLPLDNINIGADISYVDAQSFSTNGLGFWNFGARGDMNISGLTIRGDIEVQTGKADGISTLGTDVDFSGWAGLVGVDYEISGIKLGAEFAYGSGDEDSADNDYEAFVTTLGGSQHYTYVYEYRTISAVNATGTGLANTWYINVGASTKPIPDFKVSGDVYYLQASEDVALNGGTPDDSLGWEIDGKLEYDIDKNLVYYVEGGVLFPGDAYDLPSEDADNAYAVRNGLVLKF